MKKIALASALALSTLAVPLAVQAESTLVTGATASTAARLEFRVIIPRVLFLAVGTGAGGTGLTANTTVDQVTFDYTTNGTAVGTGAVAASVVGNVVPVRILGNNGQVTLAATTAAATLANATGDTIPWTQITATSSDATNFPHPTIGAAAINIPLSTGTKITNRTANWTYSYANDNVVPAGTYGGGGVAASRVTYTAAMP